MWTGLLYLISIVVVSVMFYKLGKEDGYADGKRDGDHEGYVRSTQERINEL